MSRAIDPLDDALNAILDENSLRLPSGLAVDAMLFSDKVRLVGQNLSFSRKIRRRARVTAPLNLLERFIGLETDSDVLAFAKQFGPLTLFETPQGLRPFPARMWSASQAGFHKESLKAWRDFVDQFRELLAMAQVAKDAKHRRASLADLAITDFSKWRHWPSRPKETWAEKLFQWRLNTYIAWCGVRPALILKQPRDLRFQDDVAHSEPYRNVGISLFGALTVQAMSAALGTPRLAFCSSCSRAFVPKRQPHANRRRFCDRPECKGERGRWASRDSRARPAEERRRRTLA
jgi:hypothetical protein